MAKKKCSESRKKTIGRPRHKPIYIRVGGKRIGLWRCTLCKKYMPAAFFGKRATRLACPNDYRCKLCRRSVGWDNPKGRKPPNGKISRLRILRQIDDFERSAGSL